MTSHGCGPLGAVPGSGTGTILGEAGRAPAAAAARRYVSHERLNETRPRAASDDFSYKPFFFAPPEQQLSDPRNRTLGCTGTRHRDALSLIGPERMDRRGVQQA